MAPVAMPRIYRSANVRWAAGRGGSGAVPFPSGLLPNPSCDVDRNGLSSDCRELRFRVPYSIASFRDR